MMCLPSLLSVLLGCNNAPQQPTRQPDIILITLDTTRADRLGAYGYADANTPTIDALANNGRVYTRAYSPQPLTIPAHGSIMTGRYPAEIGIRGNGDGFLETSEQTLAETLKGAGYQTHASVSAYVTTRIWGFDQGFDSFGDQWSTEAGTNNFWSDSRTADAVVDEALARYAVRAPDVPAFMWLHLYDAHRPYEAPDEYVVGDREYDGEIAFVDAQIARLVEGVDAENTLFVLVGDHGEGLGDHGELEHGMFVYDATQRVPMIISGPGVPIETVNELTSLIDVMPTILSLTNITVPDTVTGLPRPGSPEKPVHMEAFYLEERFGLAPHIGVIEGDHKFINVPEAEVYDLSADPSESENIAASDANLVSELSETLQGFGFPAPGDREALPSDMAQELMALGYVEPIADVQIDGSLDPKAHKRLIGLSQRALQQRRRGQLDQALATLNTLVTEYPTIPELRMRYVQALTAAGRTDEADEQALALADIAPDHVMGRTARAHRLIREEKPDEAIALLLSMVEDRSYDPTIRAEMLRIMMTYTLTRERGLQQAQQWHEQYPDDHNVSGVLGIELAQRGKFQEAIPLLEAGMKASVPEPGTAFHTARINLLMHQPELALTAIERELAANPTYPDAASLRVEALARLSRWDEVIADGAALAESEDAKLVTLHGVSQAYFNKERYAESRALLDRALARDGDNPELMTLDANLMVKEGRPRAEAEARFNAAQTLLTQGIEARLAGMEQQGRGVEASPSAAVPDETQTP